jgi:(p)ppGpp synthase/HD superfamily hydrolase
MPLRTELYNGQTVEIITSPGARPNPAWLNFVHTAKARSNIRHYLKNLRRDEAISLGHRLLNKDLEQYDTDLDNVPKKRLKAVLKDFHIKDMDTLLEEIGLGNRMPVIIARALMQGSEHKRRWFWREKTPERPLAIKGTEGTVVTFAKCCRPIPGDPILGFVSAGRGIVIHTETCKNVAEYRNKPEKWIDVQWENNVEGDFPVELRLMVQNKRGVLATIAAAISEMKANIENVNMEERDGMHTSLNIMVSVHDRAHLAGIMRRLRSVEMVNRINRVSR